MKTKAYKLAAELGVGEKSLLDWLRRHGYPNARRADTIRSDVAQAARNELGRSGHRTAPRVVPRVGKNTDAPRAGEPPREDPKLRASFAELLEAHLPPERGRSAESRESLPSEGERGLTAPLVASDRPLPAPPPPSPEDQVHRMRVARLEAERDNALRDADAYRTRLNSAREALSAAQQEAATMTAALAGAGVEAAALRETIERLRLERSTLRAEARESQDAVTTLAQTCGELEDALTEMREALAERSEAVDRSAAASQDLESTRQREMAWRARALELERTVHGGGSLGPLLARQGVSDPEDQVRVLRALVGRSDSGLSVLRAIRQVDSTTFDRLVAGRVARVCPDPICHQVAALDARVVIDVDSASACEICRGSEDRRWVVRLSRECVRSGVRRVLVVGGDPAAQEALRELCAGLAVDFRLVAERDEVTVARAFSRVEGSDVVVVWGDGDPAPDAPRARYAAAALASRCPLARVPVTGTGPASVARAVCNLLARNHLLTAT